MITTTMTMKKKMAVAASLRAGQNYTSLVTWHILYRDYRLREISVWPSPAGA